ncbi:uncharacterized protein JN550_001349 [Neoarthrinium moseri]|uniref:uncharacterized protein n=1 Tax=Neoarthrinium moseri TaxID=1658444 RepID=UPI001FDE2BC2|nr:uncharacterized protein JN550_001349 [Neoarthrinium moseri]KAI1877277.1 hypothetical protein JN550_001349 [Neoarthrinium moseri]
MCSWQNPRAAHIRDTVWIDGGYLWWTPGLADGSLAPAELDLNPLGSIYQLNFSRPFNTSANISEILTTVPKGSIGNSLNNLAPNYFDGAMLANDNEFFLYGGLLTYTDTFAAPDAENVIGYQQYQYGAPKEKFNQGFLFKELPEGDLTRYLAFGGAANAPSENKAYYFGGMRSRSWGPIYVPTINDSLNALETSDTLITLDMTTQQEETWHNDTLPPDIKGRGGSSLVWVPVGEQGILVALGGVTKPDFTNGNLTSENEGQSKNDSPAFMSTIDIFDIASKKWYKQDTIGGPGQLALGCAVVSVAKDLSSYSIYYYGGYDGLHMDQPFNDDVWILSLPSFMWMKVSSGKPDHARAGHQCFTPYPDQMVVVGGYPSNEGSGSLNCLEDGVVQVFNLTEGKWQESYDPEVYGEYGVPEMIHLMIGGDYAGGATMTVPTPTGWATPELSKVFQTTYATSKITTYYPYARDNSNGDRTNMGNSAGLPTWVAPVLGVVLGLVFISAIVVGILLYRRRKLLRRGGVSEGGTVDENGNRVLSWIRGQDGNHKAGTVTTEETPNNIDDMESQAGGQTPNLHHQEMAQARSTTVQHHVQEMPDTPLVELMDTSPRVELGDTGLTPIDIINKHTHFAPRTPHSARNPSSFGSSSYAVSGDHASVSTNSQARGLAGTPSLDPARPDSPALGTVTGPAATSTPEPEAGRVVSDLSSVSQREQAHLRNISDVTVSSAAGTAPPTPVIGSAVPGSPPPPVSPPTAEGREQQTDYFQPMDRAVGGNAPSSPLARPSVFRESKTDLEDGSGKR